MTEIVHALGDGEHCRACGLDFPCQPWIARTRVEVHPMAWPQTVETYSDAPRVKERVKTALMGETK